MNSSLIPSVFPPGQRSSALCGSVWIQNKISDKGENLGRARGLNKEECGLDTRKLSLTLGVINMCSR